MFGISDRWNWSGETAGKKAGRGEESAAAENIYKYAHPYFFTFFFRTLAENRFDPGRRVEPRVPMFFFALRVSAEGDEGGEMEVG